MEWREFQDLEAELNSLPAFEMNEQIFESMRAEIRTAQTRNVKQRRGRTWVTSLAASVAVLAVAGFVVSGVYERHEHHTTGDGTFEYQASADGLTLGVKDYSISGDNLTVDYELEQTPNASGSYKYDISPKTIDIQENWSSHPNATIDEVQSSLTSPTIPGRPPTQITSSQDGTTQVYDFSLTYVLPPTGVNQVTLFPYYLQAFPPLKTITISLPQSYPIMLNPGSDWAVKISNIQFLPDKTVVTYEPEGGFPQMPPIWFVDSAGRTYQQIAQDATTTTLTYPAISSTDGLTLQTQSIPGGGEDIPIDQIPIKSLEITIPLKR